MSQFKQVSIIGIGLIGGSIAKAIKKNMISESVVGFFRKESRLKKAVKNKIIDKGFLNLEKAVEESDLIIIALPISKILEFLPKIANAAQTNAIITDVGSIKSKITSLANRLNCNFVGSHPLAGSEKNGSEFSKSDLFKKSLVIITPTKKTDKSAMNKIRNFWKRLGSNVVTMTAQNHDKILSFTSHLPHVLAFSLISCVPDKFMQISASGLKDTTRIAKSDALIWADIFLNNKTELNKSIKSFEAQLTTIKKLLNSNNKTKLVKLLNLAKNKREKLP